MPEYAERYSKNTTLAFIMTEAQLQTNTQLKIANHIQAIQFLDRNRHYHAAVFTNAGLPCPLPFGKLARSVFHRSFDDMEVDRPHAPNKQDIIDLLEWQKGKEHIICACHAGRSRSSAAAYIISQDLSILDPEEHQPNMLMVAHASEILEKPQLLQDYKKWLQQFGTL